MWWCWKLQKGWIKYHLFPKSHHCCSSYHIFCCSVQTRHWFKIKVFLNSPANQYRWWVKKPWVQRRPSPLRFTAPPHPAFALSSCINVPLKRPQSRTWRIQDHRLVSKLSSWHIFIHFDNRKVSFNVPGLLLFQQPPIKQSIGDFSEHGNLGLDVSEGHEVCCEPVGIELLQSCFQQN